MLVHACPVLRHISKLTPLDKRFLSSPREFPFRFWGLLLLSVPENYVVLTSTFSLSTLVIAKEEEREGERMPYGGIERTHM